MLENILKEKQKIHHKINNIKSVLELLWQGAGQEADTADQPRPESRLRNQFQKISAPVKYNQIKSYKVCLNWMNLRSASRSWCTNKIERFFHVCRLKCPDELKCGDAVPPASVCVFIPGGGGLRGGASTSPWQDRVSFNRMHLIYMQDEPELSWGFCLYFQSSGFMVQFHVHSSGPCLPCCSNDLNQPGISPRLTVGREQQC